MIIYSIKIYTEHIILKIVHIYIVFYLKKKTKKNLNYCLPNKKKMKRRKIRS